MRIQRLSSKRTFCFTRIFPIFWFGFWVLFVVSVLVFPCQGGSTRCPPFLFVIIPIIMAVVGGINRVTYDVTSKPPCTIEWD